MESPVRATILLVEDDPGVARLEQLRLERAGYVVVAAATAEEGLEQIATGQIDLIILDQRLNSGTSGLEFFRKVKEAGHNVPAILVTGLNDENTMLDALRAGVRDFVPKTPNFLNHLEPIVNRVLDQVRTERELAESRIVAREHEARRRDLEHESAQQTCRTGRRLCGRPRSILRLMVSVKSFAIFTIDPQGRIVSWNPNVERLFGYPEAGNPRAAIRRPVHAGGPIRRRPRTRNRHRHRQGPRVRRAAWHPVRGWRSLFASGVVTPIFDEENKLRGFTKIARDITEPEASRGSGPRGGPYG